MAEINYKRDYGLAPASPFWIVLGAVGKGSLDHRLNTREEAEARAADLASRYPGSEYHVLGCVAMVRTNPEIIGLRFDPQRTPPPPPPEGLPEPAPGPVTAEG